MKQYTIGVTVSCKKLMKVIAHNNYKGGNRHI